MDFFSLLNFVSRVIIIIPAIAGGFRYKMLSFHFKLFYWFLLFTLVFEILLYLLASNGIRNDWVLNFYASVEFLFTGLILNSGNSDKRSRKLINSFLYVIIFIWLIYFFYLLSDQNNSKQSLIKILGEDEPLIFIAEAILLIILSLYILFKIFWERQVKVYYKNEYFWVALGIFTYFTGTIILYPSIRIIQFYPQMENFIWICHSAFNILGYLFIARAYFCTNKN